MKPRLSWSKITDYQSCPRRFYLTNVEKWQKKITPERRPLLLGSAVHSGIETALWYMAINPQTAAARPESLIIEAANGVRAYIEELRSEIDQQYGFDLTTGKHFGSSPELVNLLDEIQATALKIVAYHIPRLGLGTQYVPVMVRDIFTDEIARSLDLKPERPAIEMHFAAEGEEYTLTGIIDALVRDVQSGQLILLDWKVRARFTSQNSVLLDNQLALYAAVINHYIEASGKSDLIYTVRQVQIKAGDAFGNGAVPRPANINKDGTPSIASQNSTWEVWSESLRAMGKNPDPYYEQMQTKLKAPEFYIYAENYQITPNLLTDLVEFTNDWAATIIQAQRFPGAYKAQTCQFCPFQRVCMARKHAGPEEAEAVLKDHFVKALDTAKEAVYNDDIE